MSARNRPRRPNRIVAALILAALTLLPLSACATPAPELEAQSAAQLQTAVLAVSEASAAGDYDAALVQLDALEAALQQASADEQLSAARAARISTSIGLVRADLAAAIEASTPEPSAPTPSSEAPSSSPPYDPDCNRGQEKKGTCTSEEGGSDEDDD